MEFIIFLIVIFVAYKLFTGGSKSSPSNKSSNNDNKAQSFLPPIPKDYQIFSSGEVSGVSFRKNDALQFANSSNQELELEGDPDNAYDKNAIKVIGISAAKKYFIGYVPKEIAKQIVDTDMLGKVKPRLARIYQGSSDYLEIHFQIIGLKTNKKQFDDFLNNKPADVTQKDYYKFFDMAIPKGLTTIEAFKTIEEHRKKLIAENSIKLNEFDLYNDILEEFDDSDFRETYEIKKPTRTILIEVLNQLHQEGKTYDYLSDNIDEVVDRVKELKPELDKA